MDLCCVFFGKENKTILKLVKAVKMHLVANEENFKDFCLT